MSGLRNKALEIDIAKKVMGLVVEGGRYWEMPTYSTSVAAAFQVRQRMRELGFSFRLSDADNGRSAVSFFHDDAEQGLAGAAVADTDAQAICEAALEAVKEKAEAASG